MTSVPLIRQRRTVTSTAEVSTYTPSVFAEPYGFRPGARTILSSVAPALLIDVPRFTYIVSTLDAGMALDGAAIVSVPVTVPGVVAVRHWASPEIVPWLRRLPFVEAGAPCTVRPIPLSTWN